jgi:hypothetical protein
MRRNYDKPHRCPGWSGPAFKGGRIEGIDADQCAYLGPRGDPGEDGHASNGPLPWNSYGLVRCPGCMTWVLPLWARWLDPTYAGWRARRRIKDWRQDRGR